MGFTKEQSAAERERIRSDLQTRCIRWQHALVTLYQTLMGYVMADADLRVRLRLEVHPHPVAIPLLKRRIRLDQLFIGRRAKLRVIDLKAIILWPRLPEGSSERVDLVTAETIIEYYLLWSGKGESPDEWTIKSPDHMFERPLTSESFTQVLERLLP